MDEDRDGTLWLKLVALKADNWYLWVHCTLLSASICLKFFTIIFVVNKIYTKMQRKFNFKEKAKTGKWLIIYSAEKCYHKEDGNYDQKFCPELPQPKQGISLGLQCKEGEPMEKMKLDTEMYQCLK